MMAHKLPEGLIIRGYQEKDKSYIASTFLNTARNLAFFYGTPDRLYYPPMQKLFDRFLRHSRTCVAVVADEDEPAVIRAWVLAWILEDVSVVWFAHTANRYRRQGICSHLLETLPGTSKATVFTSRIGERIRKKHRLVKYSTLILEVIA
jgi:ribosomal protein S18 acetylase RimI-like enzyme